MIKKTVCLIAFFIVILNTNAFAQEVNTSTKKNSFWFTVGTGASLPIKSLPVLYTNFTYDYKDNLFSLRYIMNRELNIVFGDEPLEKVHDIGLLYGRLFFKKRFSIYASGGLSYVFGIKRGQELPSNAWFVDYFEEVKISTIGIPLETTLSFTPSKYFGFGFNMFGNINIEQSYIGAGFYVSAGDMLKLQKVYLQYKAQKDSLRILRRAAYNALPSEVKKRRKVSHLIIGLSTLAFSATTLGFHLRAHSSEGAAQDYKEMRDGSTSNEDYEKYDKMYKEEKELIRSRRILGNISAGLATAGSIGFILSFRI